MRPLRHFAIAALLTAAAIASVGAQEGSGRNGSRGGGGGGIPGSGRVGGGEAVRERREAVRERMAERSSPEDRRGRRDAMRERLKGMSPEDRAALADRMRGRGGERARTPEQAAFAQALREKRRELRGAVTAGTLDRKTAAEQLRGWMTANRPAAPTSP